MTGLSIKWSKKVSVSKRKKLGQIENCFDVFYVVQNRWGWSTFFALPYFGIWKVNVQRSGYLT